MFLKKTPSRQLSQNSLVIKRRERIVSRQKVTFHFHRSPIFIILVITILLSTALYVVFTRLSVQHIYCRDSDHTSCPPELIQQLEQFKHKPLLFLNIDQIDTFIQDFQQYDTLEWNKQYPDTLVFTAHKSPPAYTIISDQKIFLVLKSGKVTEIDQKQQHLSLVHFSTTPMIDKHQLLDASIHHAVLTILSLTTELPMQLFQITWFDKNDIQLELQNGKKLRVKSDDLDTQFRKITMILNRETEIEEWNELDVRFQHPVVR